MKSEQTNYGKIGKIENFIEQLSAGSIFEFNSNIYILTHDFKKNASRLAVCISDGLSNWLPPETIVRTKDLYSINHDGHFVKINNANENIIQTEDVQ